jgi:hypothetical protein
MVNYDSSFGFVLRKRKKGKMEDELLSFLLASGSLE